MNGDDDPYWLFNQVGAAGRALSVGVLWIFLLIVVLIGLGIALAGGIAFVMRLPVPPALVVGPLVIAIGAAWYWRSQFGHVTPAPSETEILESAWDLLASGPLGAGPHGEMNRTGWTPPGLLDEMRLMSRRRARRLAELYANERATHPRDRLDAPIDATIQPVGLNSHDENVLFVLGYLAMQYAAGVLGRDALSMRDGEWQADAVVAAREAVLVVMVADWMAPDMFERLMRPWRTVFGETDAGANAG